MSEISLYESLDTSIASREPPSPLWALQGYLAHKKPPPPEDHHRTLGIALL